MSLHKAILPLCSYFLLSLANTLVSVCAASVLLSGRFYSLYSSWTYFDTVCTHTLRVSPPKRISLCGRTRSGRDWFVAVHANHLQGNSLALSQRNPHASTSTNAGRGGRHIFSKHLKTIIDWMALWADLLCSSFYFNALYLFLWRFVQFGTYFVSCLNSIVRSSVKILQQICYTLRRRTLHYEGVFVSTQRKLLLSARKG